MEQPLVSVLMPVYNAENFLDDAIQSILNQTFTNFELLLFNDCSKDNSWQIIQKYAERDNRIVAFNSEKNKGYVEHLNYGIQIAKGKYIARMDNDDISLPHRFERQVSFLENSPQHVMCGTWFQSIGVRTDLVKLPHTDEEIRLKLLYSNMFCHPSVMMRTETLKNHNLFYHKENMPSEDYLLWTSLSKVGLLANIPEVLFHYRFHQQNFSNSAWKPAQEQKYAEAQKSYRKFFFNNIALSEEQHELLHLFFTHKLDRNINNIQTIAQLLSYVLANYTSKHVSKKRLHAYFNESFYYLCTTSTHLGWRVMQTYLSQPFRVNSLNLNLKLFFKAVAKYKAS